MPTISYVLQEKGNKAGENQISLSVYISRQNRFQISSGIWIKPSDWSNKYSTIKIPGFPGPLRDLLVSKKETLGELSQALLDDIAIAEDPSEITRYWAERYIREFYRIKKKENDTAKTVEIKRTLVEDMQYYLDNHKMGESRVKHFRTIIRCVMRFQLYIKEMGRQDNILYLDELTPADLKYFHEFIGKEDKVFQKYPWIYEQIPLYYKDPVRLNGRRKVSSANLIRKNSIPQKRALNYTTDMMIRFKTYVIWANDMHLTTNNPFKKYPLNEPVYGSPIYITVQERKQLYNTDMSYDSQLETQRDIFVLQSLLGCRISDLYEMTYDDIINDSCIEYIANKTNMKNPKTLSIPLSETAKDIIKKYWNPDRRSIMPFISECKYNKYIKEAFKVAGLTRMVTIVNKHTHKQEHVPLNEIASSHMARRSFIGNMYKQVKDQNLVAALSGHKEGSKAFARYRNIDDEMRRELISYLE